MLEKVLEPSQTKLLPLVSSFSSDFGLIGGTAVALHLNHRKSIDFDLASNEKLNHQNIRAKIIDYFSIQNVLIHTPEELTLIVESVKLTFIHYPFEIKLSNDFEGIKTPSLLTLAAMKAYALGRRSKWKDYVDLYFIFQKHTLIEVVDTAKRIFKNEFNEKLFREQLSYFSDLDYSETIDFCKGFETTDETIKSTLTSISLQR